MYKIFIVFLLISIVLGVVAGADISTAMHSKMYEALRITSGIIFGVVGAWITIVFPDLLTKIYKKESVADGRNLEIFRVLRKTMYIAVLIITITLIFNIFIPIFSQFPFFIEYKAILKMISLTTLIALTCVQIWALLATLAPIEISLFSIEKKQRDRSAIERRNSVTQDKKDLRN